MEGLCAVLLEFHDIRHEDELTQDKFLGKEHFRLSKDAQACQLLSEAISFAEAKK